MHEIAVEPIPEVRFLSARIQPQTAPPLGRLPSASTLEDQPAETENRPPLSRLKSNRGRLPADVRAYIVKRNQEQIPLEQIAQETSRSLKAVRKAVGLDEEAPSSTTDPGDSLVTLDEVIQFLCSVPDEAFADLIQLAKLSRQREALRSSVQLQLHSPDANN